MDHDYSGSVATSPATPPPPKRKRTGQSDDPRRFWDKKRGKTRVNIGAAFTRWRNLRDKLGLQKDADLACFLLDRIGWKDQEDDDDRWETASEDGSSDEDKVPSICLRVGGGKKENEKLPVNGAEETVLSATEDDAPTQQEVPVPTSPASQHVAVQFPCEDKQIGLQA